MNNLVRQFLIDTARQRTSQVINYQLLSDKCHLRLQMEVPAHRDEIGKILGEISVYEHEHKRPLLSALVIHKRDDYEGDGFYKLAESLGYGNWHKLKKEGLFEIAEIKKCINFWCDDKNYSSYYNI